MDGRHAGAGWNGETQLTACEHGGSHGADVGEWQSVGCQVRGGWFSETSDDRSRWPDVLAGLKADARDGCRCVSNCAANFGVSVRSFGAKWMRGGSTAQ